MEVVEHILVMVVAVVVILVLQILEALEDVPLVEEVQSIQQHPAAVEVVGVLLVDVPEEAMVVAVVEPYIETEEVSHTTIEECMDQ